MMMDQFTERSAIVFALEHGHRWWLRGRMKDGSSILIRFEFKSDRCPGFDARGNRFEAYTSWFRFERSDRYEFYVQTDRQVALAAQAPITFLWHANLAALREHGVDTETLVLSENREI